MAILPDRSALTTPADGDLYMTTDVSDTTDAATGTDKKITWANIKAALLGQATTTVGTGAETASLQSSGDFNLTLKTGNTTTGYITIFDGTDGGIRLQPDGNGSVSVGTSLLVQERAAAVGDSVGWGQVWVKNDTPNVLKFTNDAGTDYTLQMQPSEGGFVDGDKTKLDSIGAASSTAAGTVELATAAELVTGTDVARAVTPGGMSAYAGGTNITKIGTLTAGNADAAVTNASSTAAGKVELATAAELVTGTDTGRAVTPGGMSAYAGGTAITKVGTLTAGNVNAVVTAATTSTAGKVELAIASEVNTGTDATRAVTPDSLAGSNLGTKAVNIQVTDGSGAITTGDGKAYFRVPSSLNGMDIVGVAASLTAPSTSGAPAVMIARGRQASATGAHSYVDVLSTAITIDANEYDSKDATTAAVINTSNDDLATGDLIRIDVDGVGSGPTAVLSVDVECRLP